MLVIVSPPLLFPKAPGSMVQGLWGSFTDKEFSKYDFLRLAKIVHGLYKMVYLFSSLDLLLFSQSKTPALSGLNILPINAFSLFLSPF